MKGLGIVFVLLQRADDDGDRQAAYEGDHDEVDGHDDAMPPYARLHEGEEQPFDELQRKRAHEAKGHPELEQFALARDGDDVDDRNDDEYRKRDHVPRESRGWIGRRDHRHDMRRMSQVDQNRHARPDGAGKRDGLRGLGVGHEVLAIGEHDIGCDELAARAKADEECEDRNHEAPCERVAHARPHEQAHRELANPRRATYRHEDDGHDDGPLA